MAVLGKPNAGIPHSWCAVVPANHVNLNPASEPNHNRTIA